MVTLSNVQGGSLVADFGPALARAFKSQEARRKEEIGQTKQQATQEQIDILTGGGVGGDAERQRLDRLTGGGFAGPTKVQERALIRLSSLNPQVGKAASDIFQRGDVAEQAEFKRQAEQGARQATFVSGQKDFASKQQAIRRLGEEAAARGEPLDRFIDLQNKSEPELDLELQRMQIMGADLKTLLKGPGTGDFAKSPGVITRKPGGGIAIQIPVLNKGTGEMTMQTVDVTGDVVSKLGETGVEQTLRLAGQAGKSELEKAKVKIKTGAKVAGVTEAGKTAIRQSEKAFEKLAPIKQSIVNIDEAIKLVDEGAGTGPVLSRLPSIREASIKLDNVQKAMGLDVIGTTTFGALSKGELDLALSKALPTNLRGDALREWLVEKKVAQEKLTSYLENAATFLGTPGNTIAGFIKQQKIGVTIPPVTPVVTPPPGGIQSITTVEEFNALPSGAIYIDIQTGKRSRKP